MSALLIVCFIIWVYLLTVFKRGNLGFFSFLVGSVGMFVFMLILLEPILTSYLSKAVIWFSGIIGNITKIFEAYPNYGMLYVGRPTGSIILYVDYECSGIIELLAFTSMLCFFQVYNIYEKIIVNILGVLWIFLANILRITIIAAIIYYFGNEYYYIAHTIIGRIVFYMLSITLYFCVFTKSQIIRQKVGNFNYGQNN